MLLERICTYRKGKQTAERKVHRMNEKTRIQIEEMKKQTIGVEVEMYNITREKAARTIAEYFHTEGTVKYIGGSYSAWACKDNKGREWKITRDSSIQAASDDEKAELGTPILTYEDIPDLQEILRQLRHKGAKSDPAHMCGVHIHIGLNGHTPKSLRNLANIMVDCQHFFRQIFLGYFSDIVQAFDTLRKNVCGDDYTSLHNPIVLSSVLPAYGMFHSIQILFL